MQRREFLVRVGGALVAAPVLFEIVGCGSDPAAVPDGFDVVNADNLHTHDFRISCSKLSSTGDEQFTATGSGHTHQVTLTPAQLQSIAAGNEETVFTNDGGHTHEWRIQKPSGVC